MVNFLDVNPYLFAAIGIIVLVVAIFFVSYFLNKKTPVPKGCENLRVSEENCMACGNTECKIKKGIDLEKIKEEIKEDKE